MAEISHSDGHTGGSEIDRPEKPNCRELRIAYQRAELVHLRAWQQLAMYQESSDAEMHPAGLSAASQAQLNKLSDESAATARAWTDAFALWWQLCGEPDS